MLVGVACSGRGAHRLNLRAVINEQQTSRLSRIRLIFHYQHSQTFQIAA